MIIIFNFFKKTSLNSLNLQTSGRGRWWHMSSCTQELERSCKRRPESQEASQKGLYEKRMYSLLLSEDCVNNTIKFTLSARAIPKAVNKHLPQHTHFKQQFQRKNTPPLQCSLSCLFPLPTEVSDLTWSEETVVFLFFSVASVVSGHGNRMANRKKCACPSFLWGACTDFMSCSNW